jgi:5'-nucleotidase
MKTLFVALWPRTLVFSAVLAFAHPCSALNILLVNDDGYSLNTQAQYDALKAAGHDVLVSIPCSNQSGKGASINFLTPITPLTAPCRHDVVPAGAPGVGQIPDKPDFYYVNGTPVMGAIYGLDVLAPQRWGKAPDLVLSGPNEGQNTGPLVNSSGTVSNAQYAASLGLSAIAVSADSNTTNDAALAMEVGQLTVRLISTLEANARGGRLLPAGIALNVNYPTFSAGESAMLKWALARHGTYTSIFLKFVPDLSQDPIAQAAGVNAPYPGIVFDPNTAQPTKQQRNDEAVTVAAGKISVTVMQAGFDASERARWHVAHTLKGLLNGCSHKSRGKACF